MELLSARSTSQSATLLRTSHDPSVSEEIKSAPACSGVEVIPIEETSVTKSPDSDDPSSWPQLGSMSPGTCCAAIHLDKGLAVTV